MTSNPRRTRSSVRRLSACTATALTFAVAPVAPAAGAEPTATHRVSVSSGGVEGNSYSRKSDVSADGTRVVFLSDATNLAGTDTNGLSDVFVRSTAAGSTQRVTVTPDGGDANGFAEDPAISADGDHVVFWSPASNLVVGDANGVRDIFLRDLSTGTTELVSVSSGEAQATSDSEWADVSADGRYVVFTSTASNLVAGDTNGTRDVFLRDRSSGTTTRVSVGSAGTQADQQSSSPAISADGSTVVFTSIATNLTAGATVSGQHVYAHDVATGSTERLSVTDNETLSNGAAFDPAVSADGSRVAFYSSATNLAAIDGNATFDVFVRDRARGTTTLVSRTPSGGTGNAESVFPAISGDGRVVVFTSSATDVVAPNDAGRDVFVHDLSTGTTEQASLTAAGLDAYGDSGSYGRASASGDGRYVSFESSSSELVASDTNGQPDVFVRDRGPQPKAPLVVNTTDDVADAAGCSAAHCSLREAIVAANAADDADRIEFSIAGTAPHVISLTSELPAVSFQVAIDAESEPDYVATPVVVLDGSAAGPSADGLELNGASSAVQGLAVSGFGGRGIVVSGSGGHTLRDNHVGTDAAGTAAGFTAGTNNAYGVVVHSSGNSIGEPGAGNLISANSGPGVYIGATATGNRLNGNLVGTDASGVAALGNLYWGVMVEHAPGNTIGGTAPGAGNVISANGLAGVYLAGAGSTGNLVQGNLIGTDATGTSALGNTWFGVFAYKAGGNTIGGSAAGARNVVSANSLGVHVTDEGQSETAHGNVVEGNYIGTDVTGTQDLGNIQHGASSDAAGTTFRDNLVSGNGYRGIFVSEPTSTGTVIAGNLIGTTADRAQPLPNDHGGVSLSGVVSAVVGGVAQGDGNTIAHNGGDGVMLSQSAQARIVGNVLHSNAELAIDLDNDGVTANDPGDIDAGSNGRLNTPVLAGFSTTAGTTTVSGTLDTAPPATGASGAHRIEVFANPVCDPSGHGEAGVLLGAVDVVVDALGHAQIDATFATTVDPSHTVTATATDEHGRTSELSACADALTGDTVWTFGSGYHGEHGDGSAAYQTVAVPAASPLTFTEVAAGGSHTVALDADGVVWTWGYNGSGQLGNGRTGYSVASTPAAVSGLSGVVDVAAHWSHSLAVKADGSVWAWGANYSGGLGDGTTTGRTTPVQVAGLTDVASVSAGSGFSVAVKGDGSVWAWGANYVGQLGDGSTSARTTPVQVSGLGDVVAVAAGDLHVLALQSDGDVFAWGHNGSGELGDGTSTNRTSPAQVSGLTGIEQVAAGSVHSLARHGDGTVSAWGYNGYGQLGDGTTTSRPRPVKASGVTTAVAVAAGGYHSAAALTDGSVRTWGANWYGQLGDGTQRYVAVSTPVSAIGVDDAVDVSAGSGHTLARGSTGTLSGWGYDGYGQLGDGAIFLRSVPSAGTALSGAVDVAAGWLHSVALDDAGTVWTWGHNAYGQVGDGTTQLRTRPQLLTGLTGVTQVEASGHHTVALKADGTVWTWGFNGYGQLGDGTATNRSTPVQVSGLSDVVAVATGPWHSLAVTSDGTVWAWGANYDGQLGDSRTTNSSTPVEVTGLADVVGVDAGGSHSAALQSDGDVFTWGANWGGQLGDGTITGRATPAQVTGLAGVEDVSLGGAHSVALTADGTVLAWGQNWSGQVGDGTTTARTSPVVVEGLSGATQVTAGYSTSYAVTADGHAWSWGAGWSGQRGDGTTSTSSVPVEVAGLRGVTAIDGSYAHTVAVAGPTLAPFGDTVAGPVQAGGSVTTDAEGDGATPADPLETAVTSPVAGDVSIQETAVDSDVDGSYQLFGQEVRITAPEASAEDPLVLTFTIDRSRIPSYYTAASIAVFRNGTYVQPCTGAPRAEPDPCVSQRTDLPDGDVRLTVLTSKASAWNFGVPAPTAVAGDPQTVQEGATTVLDGSRSSHPDADEQLRYTWTPAEDLDDAGRATPTFTAQDDGVTAFSLTVTDEAGQTSASSTSVVVTNAAPVIRSLVAAPDPVLPGVATAATVSFDDPGAGDTHHVTVDWGDGTTAAAAVVENAGAGQATASHAYAAAGVYTVTVTVTDDDGASTTATTYLGVHTATGSLAGRGSFASPAGAVTDDPALAGDASFSVSAKYPRRGALTGKVSFAHPAGGLRLTATSLEWLVVRGGRAYVRGAGTLEGRPGTYDFVLVAQDGSPDGVRMRIWSQANGQVVYDSAPGDDLDAPAVAPLTSGALRVSTG